MAPTYTASERRAMAAALHRAADRVAADALRAERGHRGKGNAEKSDQWIEVRTLKHVEASLREWADACGAPA